MTHEFHPTRAFIILMDSFGIGASADAVNYGDAGADTLRHIAEQCAANHRPLHLPNLIRLGLNRAAEISGGKLIPGFSTHDPIEGAYGCAVELSLGKDTPSGHWEIAGVPALFDWGYFPPDYPSFPDELINNLIFNIRFKFIGIKNQNICLIAFCSLRQSPFIL